MHPTPCLLATTRHTTPRARPGCCSRPRLAALGWYALACAASPVARLLALRRRRPQRTRRPLAVQALRGHRPAVRYGRRAYNHLTRTRERARRADHQRAREVARRAARADQPVEGPPMTRHRHSTRGACPARSPSPCRRARARRLRRPPRRTAVIAPGRTRQHERGGAAPARRPARAAGPAAPSRLPTRLRPRAGVQLRPGLDRRHHRGGRAQRLRHQRRHPRAPSSRA